MHNKRAMPHDEREREKESVNPLFTRGWSGLSRNLLKKKLKRKEKKNGKRSYTRRGTQ